MTKLAACSHLLLTRIARLLVLFSAFLRANNGLTWANDAQVRGLPRRYLAKRTLILWNNLAGNRIDVHSIYVWFTFKLLTVSIIKSFNVYNGVVDCLKSSILSHFLGSAL